MSLKLRLPAPASAAAELADAITAHEAAKPIGFALSYQATREQVYTGELPPGFVPNTSV